VASRWRSGLAWLRAADLRLLVELLAIGVLILAFLAISDQVTDLDSDAIDRGILLGLRNAPDDPIGSRAVESAVIQISALGSGAVTGLIVLIATAYLMLAGRWRYALLVVACAIGTLVWMELLKGLYERPRPTVVTQIDPIGGLSFPSGHSMIAAALYPTLAMLVAGTLERRRLRVFAVAAGALLALLIGISRLYLGVHYPTDVLGGWTVGLGWALICGLVIRRIGGERGLDPDAPRPT
jgi:undecaprenyl-diphosphatase